MVLNILTWSKCNSYMHPWGRRKIWDYRAGEQARLHKRLALMIKPTGGTLSEGSEGNESR